VLGQGDLGDFGVALRTWSLQEKIVEESYAITELLGLDPALAEEVSGACRGGNSTYIAAAVARLFGAANEELEER
jgi:hypothetical protein